MTVAPKISACVDCAVTIIGERLRCPACHDRHSTGFVMGDEDVTLRRGRDRRPAALWLRVLTWIFGAIIFVIVASVLMAVGRGCR